MLQPILEALVGAEPPVAVEAYDGSRVGPADPPATIVVRSPDALRRIVTRPGELGFSRAYVAGDLDIEGDVFAALSLKDVVGSLSLSPSIVTALVRELGVGDVRPLPPPPEEVHLRGRRHSRRRDAAAIAHHYDVSNDFYRLLLGPSMTYSCAVWTDDPGDTLEDAQARKYELICDKLGLREGTRLLDVGCGWGGMALHAAARHGVQVLGVTVSQRQVDLARKRVAEAGLADRVEIRNQDYRDVPDGPFDAISSIGMFEHVGAARIGEYFSSLRELVGPRGRLLNHAISRPPYRRSLIHRPGFIDRYVFPDGELIEIGEVCTAMQDAGWEVRDVEGLREHYALTLRRWVANLEAGWDDAVELVGRARARVWRLYLAGSALNFESGDTLIYQTLGVAHEGGDGGIALRPSWRAPIA